MAQPTGNTFESVPQCRSLEKMQERHLHIGVHSCLFMFEGEACAGSLAGRVCGVSTLQIIIRAARASRTLTEGQQGTMRGGRG